MSIVSIIVMSFARNSRSAWSGFFPYSMCRSLPYPLKDRWFRLLVSVCMFLHNFFLGCEAGLLLAIPLSCLTITR